ncbi:MAG: hypothetical protein IPK19_16525 [Chloroflexi bacterium]|nr:hypothetical protein [Chloroflexota bacterium]
MTYVLPEDTLAEVVERLLTRLKQVGLHATVLYLDKGFCCGEIIGYLQGTQQAAVLACPIAGKRAASGPCVMGEAVSTPTTRLPMAPAHV